MNLFKKISTVFLSTTMIVGSALMINNVNAATEDAPNPFTNVTVKKVSDGTGHGTSTQTFITSKNGYKPGDDTATDGVVSSGDIVLYNMDVKFNAALQRNVKVELGLPDMLEAVDGFSNACKSVTSLKLVSSNDTSCVFTVPSGAAGSFNVDFPLVAKDSAGKIVSDQKVVLNTSVNGSAVYGTSSSTGVTVVSAPANDLLFSNNGGIVSSESLSGTFNIRVDKLNYLGSSTDKGVTSMVPWSAKIDVNDFPKATTWSFNGKPVVASSGLLSVSGVGNAKLSYTLPNNAISGLQDGQTVDYDIRLIVDENSFSTEGFKNNGTGWQPGDDEDRDYNTFDKDLGSVKGYIYPNNDYSRLRLTKKPPVTGSIFTKRLYVPGDRQATVFENGNKFWKDSKFDRYSPQKDPEKVSLGTEVRQELVTYSQNITAGVRNVVMVDTWDLSHQYVEKGTQIKVLDPKGETFDSSKYTVQWSTTKDVKSDNASVKNINDNAGWVTEKIPSRSDYKSVRIIFKDTMPTGTEANSGTYTVVLPAKVKTNLPKTSAGLFGDYMTGDCTNCTGLGYIAMYLELVFPTTPSLEITNDIVNSNSTVNQGGTLNHVVTTSVNNIQSVSNTFPLKINVDLDRCSVDPKAVSLGGWKMDVIPAKNGNSGSVCGDPTSTPTKLVFTMDNIGTNRIQQNLLTLPEIKYTTKVSNVSGNVVDNKAVFSIKDTGVLPVADDDKVTITLSNQSLSYVEALDDVVEVTKKLNYRVTRFATDPFETIVMLPTMNGDEDKYWQQVSDTTQYPADLAKRSKYNGTYTVSNVKLDPSSTSAGTKVYYTNDRMPSGTSNWIILGSNSDYSKATGFKFVSPNSTGVETFGSVMDIELTPRNNKSDDVYLMWMSSSTFTSGGNAAPSPWPALIKVVDSTITGIVWWDENNNAELNSGEKKIAGSTVTLFRIDANGNRTKVADTVTSINGTYKFDGLYSGNYMTEITSRGPNLDEFLETYYGENLPINTTYSWNGKKFEGSKISSDIISLPVDTDLNNINYGFFERTPLVDLDKSPSQLDCPDDSNVCTVSWNVAVENIGNTTLKSGVLTDTMSNSVYDVKLSYGEKFSKIHDLYNVYNAIDSKGNVWSWGSYSDLARISRKYDSPYNIDKVITDESVKTFFIDTSGYANWPKSSTKVKELYSTGTNSGYSIDTNNKLWTWGNDRSGSGYDDSFPINNVPRLMETGASFQKIVNYKKTWIQGLTTDGRILYWTASNSLAGVAPMNTDGESNVKFVDVQGSPDGANLYALDTQGRVWASGSNSDGAFGFGPSTKFTVNSTLYKVPGFPTGLKMEKIYARSMGGYAIDSNGEMWTWGSNKYQMNPNGNSTAVQTPPIYQATKAVGFTDGTKIKEIYIPEYNFQGAQQSSNNFNVAYAIDTNGKVWGWGSTLQGTTQIARTNKVLQLGKEIFVAGAEKMENSKIVDIVFSKNNVFALDEQGRVWSWGVKTAEGTIGRVENSTQYPSLVEGFDSGTRITKIKAGYNNVTTLDSNGQLWTWGEAPIPTQTYINDPTENTMIAEKIIAKVDGSAELIPFGYTSKDPVYQTPTSEIVKGSFTERKYSLQDIEPGETAKILVEGKINRGKTEQIIANQAWYVSENTPRTTPTVPNLPTSSTLNPEGITGNTTCTAQDQKAGTPDACDQVPTKIPATDKALSSLSGMVWVDTNRDGKRASTETVRVGEVEVNLYDANNNLVGTTTTTNGTYKFNDLLPGTYKVMFGAKGLKNSKGESYAITTQTSNCPTTGSVSCVNNSGTTANITVGTTERINVDAGLITYKPSIQLEKFIVKTDGTRVKTENIPLNTNGISNTREIVIEYTNNGDERLNNVKLTDIQEGVDATSMVCNSSLDSKINVLEVGEKITCTLELRGLSSGEFHNNTATVDGTGAFTDVPVSDNDTVTITTPPATPSITIKKYVDDTNWTANAWSKRPSNVAVTDNDNPSDGQTLARAVKVLDKEKVNTTYVVTNNGNVTLNYVTVYDVVSGNNVNINGSCEKDTLKPGESTICYGIQNYTGFDNSNGYVLGYHLDTEGNILNTVDSTDPAYVASAVGGVKVTVIYTSKKDNQGNPVDCTTITTSCIPVSGIEGSTTTNGKTFTNSEGNFEYGDLTGGTTETTKIIVPDGFQHLSTKIDGNKVNTSDTQNVEIIEGKVREIVHVIYVDTDTLNEDISPVFSGGMKFNSGI